MFEKELRAIPFDEIPNWEIISQPEYLDSVYEQGIREPILAATWKKKLSILDGRRRVASLKAAHKKAEEDGTLKSRPWLNELPVLVYQNMPPVDQAAWAIMSNEERSDDDLQAYLIIKAYQDKHEWDKVAAICKLNKARYNQIMNYAKLKPDLLQAAIDHRLSKTGAAKAAKMGEHQTYLAQMTKGKTKITGKDIKAASEARATAVLQLVTQNITPAKAAQSVARLSTLFLLLDDVAIEDLKKNKLLFENFNAAFEESNTGKNMRIYRLVEV